MQRTACPTDVVEADATRVWDLITIPAELGSWVDARLETVQNRAVAEGDRLLFSAGPAGRFRVVFEVGEVVPKERLAITVRLPFGVVNHEVITVREIAPGRCRVTFA